GEAPPLGRRRSRRGCRPARPPRRWSGRRKTFAGATVRRRSPAPPWRASRTAATRRGRRAFPLPLSTFKLQRRSRRSLASPQKVFFESPVSLLRRCCAWRQRLEEGHPSLPVDQIDAERRQLEVVVLVVFDQRDAQGHSGAVLAQKVEEVVSHRAAELLARSIQTGTQRRLRRLAP